MSIVQRDYSDSKPYADVTLTKGHEIRIICRTCDFEVPCQFDDLGLLAWFTTHHSRHEVWLRNEDGTDNFHTRLEEHVQNTLRLRRFANHVERG